jgi:hypothetical protein
MATVRISFTNATTYTFTAGATTTDVRLIGGGGTINYFRSLFVFDD